MILRHAILLSFLSLVPVVASAQSELRAADGRALSIVAASCAATVQYGDEMIGDECLRYGLALLRAGDEDAASAAFARACRLRSMPGCRMAIQMSIAVDSALATARLPEVRQCDTGTSVTCPDPLPIRGRVILVNGKRILVLQGRDVAECQVSRVASPIDWTLPESEACLMARSMVDRPGLSRLDAARFGSWPIGLGSDGEVPTSPSDAQTYGSTNSQGSVGAPR